MSGSFRRRYAGLWLFGAALGYFEATIVVYLRQLYYPGGFRFPLREMPVDMLAVEVGREAASLLLLLGVAIAAARSRRERWPVFFLTFGIWDIFYYLFLLVLLGWPSSPGTWDILFLIPVPWTSPVWAPVLVALLFVTVSTIRLRRLEAVAPIGYRSCDIALMVVGGLIVLLSFLWNALPVMECAVPSGFPLAVYIPGLLLMAAGSLRGVSDRR